METPNVLFTCYLLYRPPDKYRFIAVSYDEDAEMYLRANETTVGQIVFYEDFEDGKLIVLLNQFDMETVRAFIVHLLNIGIDELLKYRRDAALSPAREISMPSGFITDEFRNLYLYLSAISSDTLAAYNLCIRLIITGMELLNAQAFITTISFSNN